MGGDIKDNIEVPTLLYMANGEDCVLPEVFTDDFDGLLQQDVDAFELGYHELLILHCLTLEAKLVDVVEVSTTGLYAHYAVNIVLLHEDALGNLLE